MTIDSETRELLNCVTEARCNPALQKYSSTELLLVLIFQELRKELVRTRDAVNDARCAVQYGRR